MERNNKIFSLIDFVEAIDEAESLLAKAFSKISF